MEEKMREEKYNFEGVKSEKRRVGGRETSKEKERVMV